MIKEITTPWKLPLDKFLAVLDLHNKEKKSLVYYTPQDIFGKLKPGLKYDDCVKALYNLDRFWRDNEQESLYYITQEERANGILLSISIEISNNKLREFIR